MCARTVRVYIVCMCVDVYAHCYLNMYTHIVWECIHNFVLKVKFRYRPMVLSHFFSLSLSVTLSLLRHGPRGALSLGSG
jgi:hypothetical protein